ncbi:MAG: metallophosphoesterase [Cryobacterium sp.]
MSTVAQLGQHAAATHLIAHVSDTHFLAESRSLYGTVNTDAMLVQALKQIDRSGLRPDALVITGDIADRGEPDAYRRVRSLVATAADSWGSAVIWVMGNHDDRTAFRTHLLGAAAADPTDPTDPLDSVTTVNGLRIITLDTSVPGFHHGDLTQAQLDWLGVHLAHPAMHGTVLALHHPPLPTPVPLLSVLELRDQHRLAAVIAGSDVRIVLAGHLHTATQGLCAGIPVSVAAATSYSIDLTAPPRELHGVNGGQAVHLVHVYHDQITHSQVPIGDFDIVSRLDSALLTRLEQLSPTAREAAFSRQPGA